MKKQISEEEFREKSIYTIITADIHYRNLPACHCGKVCEWKLTDEGYILGCLKQLTEFDFIGQSFEYCPWCGGEIKEEHERM